MSFVQGFLLTNGLLRRLQRCACSTLGSRHPVCIDRRNGVTVCEADMAERGTA